MGGAASSFNKSENPLKYWGYFGYGKNEGCRHKYGGCRKHPHYPAIGL